MAHHFYKWMFLELGESNHLQVFCLHVIEFGVCVFKNFCPVVVLLSGQHCCVKR